MLIWRIETKCGKGFYRSGGIVPATISDMYQRTGDIHPSPYYDIVSRTKDSYLGDRMYDSHIFGFASVKAARRWFCNKDDLAKLKMCRLVAYSDFSRFVQTPNQCIFVPTDAKLKASFLPTDLHNLSAHQLCKQARHQLRELSC